MPIGDEAINVFMAMPGEDPRLELTYNHGVDRLRPRHRLQPHRPRRRRPRRHPAATRRGGIEPEKPPYRPGGRTEGHRICFVRDPDGYRIELIGE